MAMTELDAAQWQLERLGTHRDVFALPVEQLTPAAFKRTLR
ncbi:MAG: hypothetical protein R3B06_12560 [Kofleriaceae bacterium]